MIFGKLRRALISWISSTLKFVVKTEIHSGLVGVATKEKIKLKLNRRKIEYYDHARNQPPNSFYHL